MEFTEYVREQRPSLLRFATVLTGQAWLADDVVSDVLGRAFERWDHIDSLARPHAYVRRMIVNDYLSWRRRLLRTTPTSDIERSSTATADSSEQYAERDAMIGRLRRLPRRQRAAVVLRYYAGLPDAEIAAELGCRTSTVRSQISRALTTLRITEEAPSMTSIPEER
ncbi:SigE family RNA polymerase sigma factor [Leekyejoonella antrihumi]|uniref:SigE family RNA polymerase sigma factor n=1 Tax=Leekyejoonella antrihumi TaxID=1660198 RepID=A0A563DUC9_9MICO|nr:SigE family RNA polymerase sigma factor [Leekyejoonella antrihumi]TWP33522.1 SigE family RNA polymerase sigma factor [Leekyejoonella antrihumi]